MSESMRVPIAVTSWCALDVKQLYPKWSDEKCVEALYSVAGNLEERCIELGWEVLGMLLSDFNDRSKNA